MDIFIIDVIDADEVHKELLKEFQKKQISDPKVWNTHCLSYLMVDRILKEVYKINDREIIFEEKKPFLKTKEKYFSISHSEDYIALAFSDSDCGIDIEKIKERDYDKIAKRMKFNCNSLDEFYYEWTRFEAEYKLGKDKKNAFVKNYRIKEYALTVVSENPDEICEIYFQN